MNLWWVAYEYFELTIHIRLNAFFAVKEWVHKICFFNNLFLFTVDLWNFVQFAESAEKATEWAELSRERQWSCIKYTRVGKKNCLVILLIFILCAFSPTHITPPTCTWKYLLWNPTFVFIAMFTNCKKHYF